MDLAYTAMGSFDIWWEGGCWEWLVTDAPVQPALREIS
jgi:fructose-1,6-bisphosphatase/inositol monophosphatase family enzyme